MLQCKRNFLTRSGQALIVNTMGNLQPGKIAARLAFYLGIIAVCSAVLAVQFQDWQKIGVTPIKLMQVAQTCFLAAVAMLLAQLVDQNPKK